MTPTGSKRERLLDWIRHGDSQDVPVLFGPGPEMAASYLDKDVREVTPAQMVRVAQATGTHNIACLHTDERLTDWPFAFARGVTMGETQQVLPDGAVRVTREFKTPEGTLRQSRVLSAQVGNHPAEYLVKGDEDLPILAHLMRRASEAAVKNAEARRLMKTCFRSGTEKNGGAFPTLVGMTPPAMTLMIDPFMDKELALYLVYDRPDLMEELMNCDREIKQAILEVAAENNVDIYRVAVNGFEWLSPDLYERYMIPQTRCIAEFAAGQGKLSWVHTCGKQRQIAERGTYLRMAVNVVESLSAPPTGDIVDLAAIRRDIGPRITTRGGINIELFYSESPQPLTVRTEHVLDAVAGYRHILGDTNPPSPPYSRQNIEAVIQTVKSHGRLFE